MDLEKVIKIAIEEAVRDGYDFQVGDKVRRWYSTAEEEAGNYYDGTITKVDGKQLTLKIDAIYENYIQKREPTGGFPTEVGRAIDYVKIG